MNSEQTRPVELERFFQAVKNLPWFDLPTAQQLSGLSSSVIQKRISLLVKRGDLCRIRPGIYSSSPKDVHHLAFAQVLCAPSFITAETAAQYHGLIPDGVFVQFSATTKRSRDYETRVGYYQFRTFPKELYGGFERAEFLNGQIGYIATPAKTIIDIFHGQSGQWPYLRVREMRFQNMESIDMEEGRRWAEYSPRLKRAWKNFERFYQEEMESWDSATSY